MLTFASLFSGGGGADIGAKNAGYSLAWGIEIDPRIAEVANKNLGGHIQVGNILDISFGDFPHIDLLHASPPCPNFSVANRAGSESEVDIQMAGRVAEFIRRLRPKFFTLENVGAYRKSRSYRMILDVLEEHGYIYDAGMINAADYGVPQTRRRWWLRASRLGLLPNLPPAEEWQGWYGAIEDLIPTLPESRFAKWQLDRLPEAIQTVMIGGGNRSKGFFEFAKKNRPDTPGKRFPDEPLGVISATASMDMRAFITDSRNGRFDGGDLTVLGDDKPIFTCVSSNGPNRYKAFLVDDQNGNQGKTEERRGLMIRDGDSPAHTISATQTERSIRGVYISDQQNISGDGGILVRSSDTPIHNITSSNNPRHAWLENGRVVAMTPRALARFQTFPDWYELPENKSLACKIIGNAVPCLLYEKISGQFIE